MWIHLGLITMLPCKHRSNVMISPMKMMRSTRLPALARLTSTCTVCFRMAQLICRRGIVSEIWASMCHILKVSAMCTPIFMALKTLHDPQADKPKHILEANIQRLQVWIHLTKPTAGPQMTIKTQLKPNSTSIQALLAPTLAVAIPEHRYQFKT